MLVCLTGTATEAQRVLEAAGLWVSACYDAQQATNRLHTEHPGILIIQLTGRSPAEWQTCMQLISTANRVTLVIVEESSVEARLTALASGADDVLSGRPDPLELVARIRALLRRVGPESAPATRLQHRDLELDIEGHESWLAGNRLTLTPVEFRILQAFIESPQHIFSRDELLTNAHAFDDELPLDRSIDVHIGELRRKLGDTAGKPRYIETIRGVGYRLAQMAPGAASRASGGELSGKVALVTGGGRGIGEAIARSLAAAGAYVTLVARTADQVESVAADLRSQGQQADALLADVAQREQIDAAIGATVERRGGLDILVCAAGMAASVPTQQMSDDLWEQLLSVNLSSAFYAARAVLPHMLEQKWGRIINVASIGAKIGYQYSAGYCAAKHGLLGLTRALAVEVVLKGITVNAVCPGFAATAMTEGTAETIANKTGRTIEEAKQSLANLSPQHRLIEPEEVARVVLMLAGEGAKGITGQAINVDGGAVVS